MSTFEVIALGVGDTFSEQHHPTALLLACDGFQLAIDCPDMYRRVLRDAARQSGRASLAVGRSITSSSRMSTATT